MLHTLIYCLWLLFFSDKFDEAVRFLVHSLFVTKVQLDITSLGSIINSFSKNGMIEVSLALISVMLKQGFQPNLIILNSLMAGFSLFRQSDKCIKLLGLLGSTANLISYTILVDSLMNESRVQEAMSFFHQMRANGISPDQFILTSVINGYAPEGLNWLCFLLTNIKKHC